MIAGTAVAHIRIPHKVRQKYSFVFLAPFFNLMPRFEQDLFFKENGMLFPALENYLERLAGNAQAGARIWLDCDGRVQGRYFNCTLTSAFQPVRIVDSSAVIGFEAFVRSYSESDPGLSLWRLLDHAASDEESIELDRLCRMLHAINFFRQAEAAHAELYLSVHDRLLAAVESNHGMAFRRILDGLDLPVERIVLQLPVLTPSQGWLLPQVADNYRRNGFRFALNAAHAAEALGLLERVRPDVIKIDAREIVEEDAALRLLGQARRLGIRVVFKRVDSVRTLDALRDLGVRGEQAIYAQGHIWNLPQAALDAFAIPVPALEARHDAANLLAG